MPAREEVDGGEVLWKVLEREREEGLSAERVAVAVVDAHLGEVAGDDVAGLLVEGHALGVPETLLGGGDLPALAELPLVETGAVALLLHEHPRRGDEDVYEAGVLGARVGDDGLLELKAVEGVLQAEHVLEEADPELVLVLLLVAATPPASSERLGISPCSRH